MFNEMVYCDGGNEACTIIKLMSRKINMGQSCNDTFFFFWRGRSKVQTLSHVQYFFLDQSL